MHLWQPVIPLHPDPHGVSVWASWHWAGSEEHPSCCVADGADVGVGAVGKAVVGDSVGDVGAGVGAVVGDVGAAVGVGGAVGPPPT